MTVVKISLLRTLRSRRTLGLCALPLLALIVGLLSLGADSTTSAYVGYTRGLLLPIVVALVAFVVGSSTVTDEREELTIFYLVQTKLSRVSMAFQMWAAAVISTLVLVAIPLVIAVVLAMNAELGVGAVMDVLLAGVLSVMAYCGLAVALGAVTRYAIMIGIGYVVLWEGTVASFATAANNLSVGSYARAVFARELPSWARIDANPPDTAYGVAALALVVICALGVTFAAVKFNRMNYP